MRAGYQLKDWLKLVRWQARRVAARMRWGADWMSNLPIVLGNAMPKSGSHLIIQVLQGLTRLGPFVNPGFPPVNRNEANEKLDTETILAKLLRMQPGDIGYGYLAAKEPYLTALTQPGRAMVFVYRDPRDMIVSHIFYATQMHPRHWMRRYYTEALGSMEERINAAIRGVTEPGSELPPIRERYEGYMGWLDRPEVLSMRFEDLILQREDALGRILAYLAGQGFTPRVSRQQAVQTLAQAIAPKKSGTFRKAQPGNWQEHFSAANKALFKELAGDLLIRLDYEKNLDW